MCKGWNRRKWPTPLLNLHCLDSGNDGTMHIKDKPKIKVCYQIHVSVICLQVLTTVSYNAKLSIQDPSFTHSWENASIKFPWNLLMYESYSDRPLPASNVVDMIIITLH